MKIFVNDYHSARKVQGDFDSERKRSLDMMKEIFICSDLIYVEAASAQSAARTQLDQPRHYQDLKRFRKKPFQL
jgi:hypothetical protein